MNLKLFGFSNVQLEKQFIISYVDSDHSDDGDNHMYAVTGFINANKTIAVYHADTLVADGTFPSTPYAVDDFKAETITVSILELHDTSFSGFVDGESYTIVVGESALIDVYTFDGELLSFNPSDLWAISEISNSELSGVALNEFASAQFSIFKKKSIIKKKYDTKLLPDELLPKTAARKTDVAKAVAKADNAQSAAEAAQTTAETAQSTAETAQSTAETAQSTAETAQSTAETAQSTANDSVIFKKAQTLTDKQKQQARDNIGAGVSNFDGDFLSLSNLPLNYEKIDSTKVELSCAVENTQNDVYFVDMSGNTSLSVYPDSIIEIFDELHMVESVWCSIGDMTQSLYYAGNLYLLQKFLRGYYSFNPHWLIEDTGQDFCLARFLQLESGVKRFLLTKTSQSDIKITMYRTSNLRLLDSGFASKNLARLHNVPMLDSTISEEPSASHGASSYAVKNYVSDALNSLNTPPTVTTADAGKVLRVSSDGAWVAEVIENSSIPKIESLDKTNVKIFRDLEDGTYVLQGYFKPYTGANSSFVFDTGALVIVSNSGGATHMQLFEPYNNQIQHLNITDSACEKTYVFLNKIGNLSSLKTTAKDTLVDAINETASAIPAVTAADDGKFLQVVDGVWAAATISNANGVSF